jgi:CheY-like chemotaxis protein
MPTMIFSSSSDPADITRAYQSGANAYLVKPGSLPELEVFLKRAFDFWAICAKPPLPERCG